jgi:hypothetical protein
VLKRLLLVATALMSLPAVAHSEGAPAGFVLSIELKGDDAVSKLVIRRGDAVLPAKLMMPLYAGDVIALKDKDSRIALELDGGAEKDVTGSDGPFALSGEVATGDDTWSLISAVAGVIGGEEDEGAVPDNMVSRGDEDDLKIPMAVHGANFILGGAPLWLAWSGGKGPYTVLVEADGAAPATLAAATQEVTITPPAGAERFIVTVTDATGRSTSATFRVKGEAPQPQASDVPEGVSGALLKAAWLTGQKDGAWSVAAVQMLHAVDDPQARALLEKIVEGWKLGG